MMNNKNMHSHKDNERTVGMGAILKNKKRKASVRMQNVHQNGGDK